MRIKNHQSVTQWNFLLENPAGEEILVTTEGMVNNLQSLASRVMSMINVYDNATDNKYSEKLREFAAEKKMDFDSYLRRVIEHQYCIRNKGRVDCWNEGVGDEIHGILSKVDGFIAQTPVLIQEIAQRAIARITPSRTKTFSACGACGGGSVMTPTQDPLGRAGKLNG